MGFFTNKSWVYASDEVCESQFWRRLRKGSGRIFLKLPKHVSGLHRYENADISDKSISKMTKVSSHRSIEWYPLYLRTKSILVTMNTRRRNQIPVLIPTPRHVDQPIDRRMYAGLALGFNVRGLKDVLLGTTCQNAYHI